MVTKVAINFDPSAEIDATTIEELYGPYTPLNTMDESGSNRLNPSNPTAPVSSDETTLNAIPTHSNTTHPSVFSRRKNLHTKYCFRSKLAGSSGRRNDNAVGTTKLTKVTLSFPSWIYLPEGLGERSALIIRAAALLGARTDGKLVTLGQVECKQPSATVRMVSLVFTDFEIATLSRFGLEAKLSKITSIVRTAAMIGLGIPGTRDGYATVPPECEDGIFRLSEEQFNSLIIKAGVITKSMLRAVVKYAPPITVTPLNQKPWLVRLLSDPSVVNHGVHHNRHLYQPGRLRCHHNSFCSYCEICAEAVRNGTITQKSGPLLNERILRKKLLSKSNPPRPARLDGPLEGADISPYSYRTANVP